MSVSFRAIKVYQTNAKKKSNNKDSHLSMAQVSEVFDWRWLVSYSVDFLGARSFSSNWRAIREISR